MFSSLSNVARRAVFAVSALAAVASFGAATHAPSADAAAFCKSGYVWREAFPGDFACVTPQDRQTIKDENALAGVRKVANSSFCVSGFVWRETRPSDLTCVSTAARSREVSNNANAVFRVADARQTPTSGTNSTVYDSTGGSVYAYGSGQTPGGAVKVYAVGPWSGPYSMGTLMANGSGSISGYAGHLSCWRNQNPATIILADQRTGNVTQAGANYAINHCG
jgi:hypothetical protein